MIDIKKLQAIAQPSSEKEIEGERYWEENEDWIFKSQEIALCLRYYLRTTGMTQKELAEQMQVSPAYVGKLLKGTENLTLKTISSLERIIGNQLISVHHPYLCKRTISITEASEEKQGYSIKVPVYSPIQFRVCTQDKVIDA